MSDTPNPPTQDEEQAEGSPEVVNEAVEQAEGQAGDEPEG